MMALIALLFLILWVVIGMLLGRLLHRLFKLDAQWRGLVVLLVVLAPFIQEVAGRLQFAYLCDKYAVVWLSPDWQKVKAAKAVRHPFVNASWTFIPIEIQRSEYIDVETGKLFMSNTGLHTKGGFFLGTLGLGLGISTSCWPENDNEIYKMIEIDQLVTKGASK